MPTTKKSRTIRADAPRKRLKDQRRVQLIHAAMDAIAEHGLAEITIRHVAETARMSRGIVNFYFETKEKMLREVFEYVLAEQALAWRRTLEDSADAQPAEVIRALLEAIFSPRLASRKRLAVWSAFLAHAAAHAPYRYRFEQEMSAFCRALDVRMKATETPPPSRILMALIHGLWVEQLIAPQDKEESLRLCEALMQSKASEKVVPLKAPQEAEKSKPRSKPAAKKAPKEESFVPVVADLFEAMG